MKRKQALLNGRCSGFRAAGFSLIELMIVVAIAGALAMLAIPAYDQYNRRANRSQAQQVMLTIQNREEQYILDARAYTDILGSGASGLNIAQDGWICAASPLTTGCTNAHYTVIVALVLGAPPTYTIRATPRPGGFQDGSGNAANSDGVLTLTSAGAKARMRGVVDLRW